MKAFSWDPASCITETNTPTGRPTTSSPTSQLQVFQTTGFALPHLSLRLINIQSVELSNIQTLKIQDAIRKIAEEEVNVLNVNIMSVDIVNTDYSHGRSLKTNTSKKNSTRSGLFNPRILENALTLLIEIRVSETALLPDELYSTILGAVQLRKYDIDENFRDLFGSKYDNVILEVDGHKTTLAPSPGSTSTPDSVSNTVPVPQNIDEKERTTVMSISLETNKTLTLVLVILFGLFFAFISFGLIAWQRKRDKRSDKAFNTRSQFLKKRKKKSKHASKRNHHVSETTLKISNSAYVDEEQNNAEERLRIGFAPNQEYASPYKEHNLKEDDEKGYDGGKSSFLESQGNLSKSSALNSATGRAGIDPEEASLGDNVLGLLYYAGASSAEEEEDMDTAKNIARMKRRMSNASSRQTRTSAKSKFSNTSSRSRKSKRTDNVRKKGQEENDYGYHREENFHDLHAHSDEPSLNGSFPVRSLPSHPPYSSCSVSTVTDDEELMTFNRTRHASYQTPTSAKTRLSSASSRSRKSKRTDNVLRKVEEDNDYDFYREETFDDLHHIHSDEPSLNGSFPVRSLPLQPPFSSCSISTSPYDEELMTFNRRASIGTAITEDAESLDVEDLFT